MPEDAPVNTGFSKLTGDVLSPGYCSWCGWRWSRGFLLVPRVQAVRTRRRWFAGLRKP